MKFEIKLVLARNKALKILALIAQNVNTQNIEGFPYSETEIRRRGGTFSRKLSRFKDLSFQK